MARSAAGKLFQTLGPTTANDLSPSRVLVLGTVQVTDPNTNSCDFVSCCLASSYTILDISASSRLLCGSNKLLCSFERPTSLLTKQEGEAVEGPPAMGLYLQLSTCVLLYVRAVLGLSRLSDGGNGRCHGNEVTRGKAARGPYDTCQIWSWSDNRRWSYGDFLQTAQLAAVTLTSDPLTLKLVHAVLVSQEPFLPSLVFVGLFVFPLGGGTGQTDRRTGSTHDGASF